MNFIAFSKAQDRIWIKVSKKAGVLGKKESRPYVKKLKSQIRKRKDPFPPGGPVRSRTGKLRKSIAPRNRFQGAHRLRSGGTLSYLKIQPWISRAKITLSPRSGKKYRTIQPLSQSDLETIQTRTLVKAIKTYHQETQKNTARFLKSEMKKALKKAVGTQRGMLEILLK